MRDKHSSKKILVSIVGLVIGIAGATGLVMSTSRPDVKVATAQPDQHSVQAAQTQVDHLTYKGQNGKTALELLKQKATVITKQSSYGEYVDSINGLVGGTGGKYWTFYVNGTMASVGAGSYTTTANDSIEWKLQ